MPAKGKRVQIYIPADLVERWDALPRYERSAEVAKALRSYWQIDPASVDAYAASPRKAGRRPKQS